MQIAIFGLVKIKEKIIRSCVHVLHDSEIIFESYKDSNLIHLGMTIKDFHLYIEDEYTARLDISITSIHESVIGYSYCIGWIKSVDIDEYQKERYQSALVKNSILEEARQIVSDVSKQNDLIDPEFKLATTSTLDLLKGIRDKIKFKEPNFLQKSLSSPLEYEDLIKNWENSEIILSIENSFQNFERTAANIPTRFGSFHRSYAHKRLAKVLSESELLERIISKPRGHAGDFRTIMYILKILKTRDLTLFGELLTRWTLKQEPSVAHRNRIKHLAEHINNELANNYIGKGAKEVNILNLGCGPAEELNFINVDNTVLKMTLVDFDEHALEYIESSSHIRKLREQGAIIKTWLIDATQYKNEIRKGNIKDKFDIIYCAGLIDYCTDASTKSLILALSNMLAPGGLCIFTNVSKCNPYSYIMNWVLDWFLRERTANDLLALTPEGESISVEKVESESTGVNIFLLLRKN